MNLRLFRKQIENLVGHLVGDYVLANGFVTPAISAREGNYSLDENTSVEGLEIIITIDAESTRMIQYESQPVAGVYAVSLVQWSGGNLSVAKALIESAYCVKGVNITVPEGLGPSVQALIRIPSSTYIQAPHLLFAP